MSDSYMSVTWTSLLLDSVILAVERQGTNFSEIVIEIQA